MGRRRILMVVCLAVALAAPAAAHAEPSWHTFPDAPGRIAPEWEEGGPSTVRVEIIGARPYLSWASPDGLTVWRLSADNTRWVQVGGRLDAPSSEVRTPAQLVSDGSTIWAFWEEGSYPALDLRVARLVRGRFQRAAAEQPNRDGTTLQHLRVASAGGRVYVAFSEHGFESATFRFLRLATDGSSYEPVGEEFGEGQPAAFLGAAGGDLYRLRSAPGSAERQLDRLSADGSQWQNVGTYAGFAHAITEHDGALHLAGEPAVVRLTGDGSVEEVGGRPFDDRPAASIASAGGVLYAAGNHGPEPDVVGFPRLAAFDGGAWQQMPLPYGPDVRAGVQLLGASDGALWLVSKVGSSSWGPFDVQIARYGEPLPPGVDEPDGPPEDPPAEPGTGGGFTQPGGEPARAPRDPKPVRGACADTLRGTPAGDRIVGRALGERILGRSGADLLFGRRGRDCIHGGAGDDVVSGGAGADALSGGSGADRIVTGSGRDAVAAGSGDDTILAVGGGADRVNCGRGTDTVRLSRNDLVKGCERVVVARR